MPAEIWRRQETAAAQEFLPSLAYAYWWVSYIWKREGRPPETPVSGNYPPGPIHLFYGATKLARQSLCTRAVNNRRLNVMPCLLGISSRCSASAPFHVGSCQSRHFGHVGDMVGSRSATMPAPECEAGVVCRVLQVEVIVGQRKHGAHLQNRRGNGFERYRRDVRKLRRM
jgi:hypothetical protein